MSGNFLSCSKDPFEFPEFRCDETLDASEEMGLISPGAENLLDFLESLELRRGPQEPALVASGKARPHASCSGASWDSSPIDVGALDLV